MKNSTFTTCKFKYLFLVTCSLCLLSGFLKCDAQSIVGKWNRVSGKKFYTSEGAKIYGKSSVEISAESDGTEEVEFKSDHNYSYTLTIGFQIKPIILTGAWSVSGNQLTLKMDPKQADPKYNPKGNSALSINTFSADANKMTLYSGIATDNSLRTYMKIDKIEETFKKM
jgi:hypothetical protein